jgi:hypothetical protein
MNTPSPAPQSDPNDALLERFALGELDPERSESLRRRAAIDAGLRSRIIALGASDADVLNRYPVEAMTRIIRERAASRSNGAERSASTHSASALSITAAGQERMARLLAFFAPGRIRWAGPVFAVLACGIFLLARQDRNGAAAVHDGVGNTQASPSGLPGDIRLKGAESGLAIFRKTGSGSELLPPRSAARPGDTLQVFYHSRRAVYGIVFSVDGSGAITLHYPEAEGPSPALRIGDMLPLPHAFRLDKAPRFERFYLVTAPRPFGSEGLLSRLRGRLPADASPADTLPGLDADFRQYPYTILKAEAGPRKSRKEPGR